MLGEQYAELKGKAKVLLQDEVMKVYCDWKKEYFLNFCAAICMHLGVR